jgi:dTDP-4-amino-4,6-dideoxygalactose transaminase
MTMDVPFFRYSHVYGQFRDAILRALDETAGRGALILQSEVREFEDQLAEFAGARAVVGVANATDGLEMILEYLGIGPGDEVLVAAHTMIATVSPIVSRGATPVFVEIGDDHLMDAGDLERRITSRTRAILPTQLNGRTAEMDDIQRVADRHGLLVVEDSAQGLGSRYRGRMAGTFGQAGVYSFYPAKLLGALGDGGAIVTNDEDMAAALRSIRDHGRDEHTRQVVRWGRNSRLDTLQAVVLHLKLKCLAQEIETRRRLAGAYHQRLGSVSELVLPPPPNPSPDALHFDTFQNYEMEAEDRDGLHAFLSTEGVGTMMQWGGKAVHEFASLGLEASLPRTERIMRRSLMLPLNSSLTDAELDYVCDRIVAYYRQ